MTGAQNLHRLAAALDRLRREAATGPCHLHPDRSAVGYIEGWTMHPKGCCQTCADYGQRHGYTIHAYERASPSSTSEASMRPTECRHSRRNGVAR